MYEHCSATRSSHMKWKCNELVLHNHAHIAQTSYNIYTCNVYIYIGLTHCHPIRQPDTPHKACVVPQRWGWWGTNCLPNNKVFILFWGESCRSTQFSKVSLDKAWRHVYEKAFRIQQGLRTRVAGGWAASPRLTLPFDASEMGQKEGVWHVWPVAGML